MRNHRPRRYHGSRNSGRGFKRNNGRSENDFLRNGLNSEMNHRRSFRGNQNAHKLQEKYLNLAKEALSSGDIILSENYFQHADHFSRIIESKKDNDNPKRETDLNLHYWKASVAVESKCLNFLLIGSTPYI